MHLRKLAVIELHLWTGPETPFKMLIWPLVSLGSTVSELPSDCGKLELINVHRQALQAS
jgi:hypothetical protein